MSLSLVRPASADTRLRPQGDMNLAKAGNFADRRASGYPPPLWITLLANARAPNGTQH
jgi:hypothetical protein